VLRLLVHSFRTLIAVLFPFALARLPGGASGHLFIVCGGNRYRGGPSGTGKQNKDCGGCDGPFGQLVTDIDPWNDKPIDHPENPNHPYDPDDMECKTITVQGKGCDEVCGCFGKVANAIEDCCIPYSMIPILMIPGSNSNSTVAWMLESCAKPDKFHWPFIPPGGIRPNPGYNHPMPRCLQDATKNLARM
jgi:hypothetical protein